jgi:hypothetical protein
MISKLLRNENKLKKVLSTLESLYNQDLVDKYEVDKYAKKLSTIDLLKICVLFVLSKSDHLHEFLQMLYEKKYIATRFRISQVCIQQVYKALKNRNHDFFRELFTETLEFVKEDIPKKYYKRFKQIYILDSTFLEYCIARLFFASFGYSSTLSKIVSGMKLHTLYDLSRDCIGKVKITGGKYHDSPQANSILKDLENCIVIFDKAYHKIKRFKKLENKNVLFVIPFKEVIKIKDKLTIEIKVGEEKVVVTHGKLSNGLKVIVVKTPEITLISNAVSCNWYELVALYQLRSCIEVFFRMLKRELKIHQPKLRNHNSILSLTYIVLFVFTILRWMSKTCKLFSEKLPRVRSQLANAIRGICELKDVG